MNWMLPVENWTRLSIGKEELLLGSKRNHIFTTHQAMDVFFVAKIVTGSLHIVIL